MVVYGWSVQDLLIQYLQLRLSFNTADQARLLILLAVCGLAIKLGLLTTLVRVLGEQGLLALGLIAYMLQVWDMNGSRSPTTSR